MRGGRWVRLAVLVAVTVLSVAGCAAIPTSGPVRQGAHIAQDNGPLDLDFNPVPPSNGATPDEILHGFIDAASSPRKDYAIAREYLTSRQAVTWDPDASVTIDDTSRTYTQTGPDTWQLRVTPVASVDSTGVYSTAPTASPTTLNFGLQKVAGQWRISTVPDGIVLDQSTFAAVFSPVTLYFYSPSWDYLVPDQRWFPTRVATAETRITKAVLAGPSKWLSGAVVSAFPSGTQLAVDAVTTSSGQALVDLSSQASSSDQLRAERMRFQLENSLSSLAQSVQLSIEGSSQNIGELPAAEQPTQDPAVDPRPLVEREGAVGFLSGGSVSQIPSISDKLAAVKPSTFAMTSDHNDAAALGQAGVYAVRATAGSASVVDSRTNLVSPTIDNNDLIWSAQAGNPGMIDVIGPDNSVHELRTPWTGADQIAGIEVSRDGTRLAALVHQASGWSLDVAGIQRGTNHVPTALANALNQPLSSGTPVSLSWTDELDVGVLLLEPGGATTVSLQQVGGPATVIAGPADGTAIVGASGPSPYLVLTSNQSLQAPSGSGWQQVADKITAVGTQLGVGQ